MKITVKQIAYVGIVLSALGLLGAIFTHDLGFMIVDSVNIMLILWLLENSEEGQK